MRVPKLLSSAMQLQHLIFCGAHFLHTLVVRTVECKPRFIMGRVSETVPYLTTTRCLRFIVQTFSPQCIVACQHSNSLLEFSGDGPPSH